VDPHQCRRQVTLFTGKVELGQGLKTALSQMAAEELDLPVSRFRVITGDTAVTPNEGGTVGSQSIEQSGAVMRQAAADVRVVLLELAAAKLKAPIDLLEVTDGKVTARGRIGSATYWQLVDGQTLQRNADGRGKPKPAKDHKIVGTPVERVDIPAKVTGGAAFVQDLRLPGMLHGRVVRPPSYNAKLESVDEAGAKAACTSRWCATAASRHRRGARGAGDRAADKLRTPPNGANRPAAKRRFMMPTAPRRLIALIVNGSPAKEPVPEIIVAGGPHRAGDPSQALFHDGSTNCRRPWLRPRAKVTVGP
jgi:CO/xanthine dehydrogenase Mo-binding subunit